MKPIKFDQQNCTFAENQPEYLPLPAHKKPDGTVISCWELSPEERKRVAETGVIYLAVLTFGRPLQPLLPGTSFEEVA